MASKIGVILTTLVLLFAFTVLVSADPSGPDSIVVGLNTTKAVSGNGMLLNISGGYIAKTTVTTTQQNERWKAFLGEIVGKFTLDDNTGSTIYDWSSASAGGEVLASTSASVTWSGIGCATTGQMDTESAALGITGSDNITATFKNTSVVNYIIAGQDNNGCRSALTYVNNITQGAGTTFEEVALISGTDMVYSSKIEADSTGYDGNTYDFQMLVPDEDGAVNTEYYLYVELD